MAIQTNCMQYSVKFVVFRPPTPWATAGTWQGKMVCTAWQSDLLVMAVKATPKIFPDEGRLWHYRWTVCSTVWSLWYLGTVLHEPLRELGKGMWYRLGVTVRPVCSSLPTWNIDKSPCHRHAEYMNTVSLMDTYNTFHDNIYCIPCWSHIWQAKHSVSS